VDNERGNTGGGGTFLFGPKKAIGATSGGTNETASCLSSKGVLGKVLSLSLKVPLLSFNGNDDVSKEPDKDSASSATVNESIGP
jgi:hypothetical protein